MKLICYWFYCRGTCNVPLQRADTWVCRWQKS